MQIPNKVVIIVILSVIVFKSKVHSTEWTQLIDKSRDWIKNFSQEFKQLVSQISESKNISIDCNDSIWKTIRGIEDLDSWAIQMINAWGSFPPKGVVIGTSTDFGSYDQCFGIEPNDIIGRPQYCLVDLKPPVPKPMPVHHNLHHRIKVLPEILENNLNEGSKNVFKSYSQFASFFYWLSLRTGICTPSKCTPKDISLLAEGFADNYGLEFKQARCETKSGETTLIPIQLIAILFASCVLMVSLAATLWDRYQTKGQTLGESPLIVQLFSVTRNVKILLAKRSSDVLPCVHGIRVLSMVWIVFCHSIEWFNWQLYGRAFASLDIFNRIESQLFLNGEYAVDSFFFIGGMLTSFMTLQYTGTKLSRFNSVGFLMTRFIRLTPQLAIFMLLTFLLPLGGWASGPIWNETIGPLMENCSTNWWWNLLYIQNWLKEKQMCAVHLWYLACDMQYHWISLLFMVPLLYKKKLGVFTLIASIIIFYLISIIISYTYDLPPGMVNTGRDEYHYTYYIELFYFKPWSHLTVFFIGFLLGVIVYQKKIFTLEKKTRYIVFGLIITGYIVCLMDTYYWVNGKPYNRLFCAFVYSTCRMIWSLSTAGLIWMCISGNGGIINTFLSAHIFTPFSRLTYSVYLTHSWVVWIYVGTRRQLIDSDISEILYIFVHNLIISYSIGFLFGVLIETPVLKLQKQLSKNIFKSEVSEDVSELRVKLNNNKPQDSHINNNKNNPL